MITKEKPNAITIVVMDRMLNKSKSITVYGSSMENVYNEILKKVVN